MHYSNYNLMYDPRRYHRSIYSRPQIPLVFVSINFDHVMLLLWDPNNTPNCIQFENQQVYYYFQNQVLCIHLCSRWRRAHTSTHINRSLHAKSLFQFSLGFPFENIQPAIGNSQVDAPILSKLLCYTLAGKLVLIA